MNESRSARPIVIGLIALSVLALAVRLYAASAVGFGDSEALYASYALFPAPAYLDHPGLIALLARALGHGAAPSPAAAHLFTAFAMTLAPWAVVLTCRLLDAPLRRSLVAGLAVAAAPEISIGLFGMTPDLPLFFAWVLVIGTFGRALLSSPGSTRASVWFVASGLLLGVACASKVSAFTLMVALLVTLASPAARAHARTVWPWAALGLALVVFSPALVFEVRHGWPMLFHRLVATQHDAGLSLRNALATTLGQLAYVSPGLAVLGVLLAKRLFHERRVDIIHALLAACVFFPLGMLGVLCLWSKVAEPHWLAPAWLPLPIYFAVTRPETGRRFRTKVAIGSIGVGLVASACVYAWVLVPAIVGLVPPTGYDARMDIANELYGWPKVAADVRRTVERDRARLNDDDEVVVVGSIWMVAAQLRAALPLSFPVGCAPGEAADFTGWEPESHWQDAEVLVFVHDARAPADTRLLFPNRTTLRMHTVTIARGGQTARVFTIEELVLRGAG